MPSLPFQLIPAFSKLTFTTIVDILIVTVLIYQLLMIVSGRRAASILAGVGVLVLVYLGSAWLGLELLRSILATLAPYTVFALIVVFQSEIRRTLARIGRRRWAGFGSRVKIREFADDILLAMAQLSQTKTGALIVVERDIGLRTFVESGVTLDAMLSRDLLLAIFQKDGALHDGAVIVQGDRVAAAACFLPLSMNPALMRKHGTRHRAGIGVTEEADCLALIVSEETGSMSAVSSGELDQDLTIEQVRNRLNRHFGERRRPGTDLAASQAVPDAGRSPGGDR
ncbi:MAG: diadenylate cyclase CdaA [Bryobacterales bacterium]|nr:diadenylate cyclase CdaA [Bryobacterales bacterium]